jgi:hypothetical protein
MAKQPTEREVLERAVASARKLVSEAIILDDILSPTADDELAMKLRGYADRADSIFEDAKELLESLEEALSATTPPQAGEKGEVNDADND